MSDSSSSSSGGIGFVGVLTIAFIVLKITGYISCPGSGSYVCWLAYHI